MRRRALGSCKYGAECGYVLDCECDCCIVVHPCECEPEEPDDDVNCFEGIDGSTGTGAAGGTEP